MKQTSDDLELLERGAGKLLVCGPIVASRIGDGSADSEARKQESQSNAFCFLPKMVVSWGKLRLASRPRYRRVPLASTECAPRTTTWILIA
jgi:hypothetical protein